MKTLYTIGYSNHTFDKFNELLENFKIDTVVDVRSSPYSQRNPEFNKDNLAKLLKNVKRHYIFMGQELGARKLEKNLYTDGILDFNKVYKSDSFLKGVTRVVNGIEKGHRIALMCSEKNPIECHRTIMISRYINIKGYEVIHILHNGDMINQNEIDEQLLTMHNSNYNQISLFGNQMSKEDAISDSYRQQNWVVGFKVDDDLDSEEGDIK